MKARMDGGESAWRSYETITTCIGMGHCIGIRALSFARSFAKVSGLFRFTRNERLDD